VVSDGCGPHGAGLRPQDVVQKLRVAILREQRHAGGGQAAAIVFGGEPARSPDETNWFAVPVLALTF
jgi:hypothetical protein